MVTLKASHEVKPAWDTPRGVMYIPEADQVTAISHAPLIYFYRLAKETEINAAEILKDSLSKALVVYYPLAGRLQWIDQGLRLELDCNSMGALFLKAESEAKIDDFEDFCPTAEIRALIPSADYKKPIHELPLLLVQLTKFSCGGISIGLAISHILADGQAAAHFISNWARIARGEQIEHIPYLDRTKLRPEESWAPRFEHPELKPATLLIGHSSNVEERNKETTVALLKLSKAQIHKLKTKANSANCTSFTSFEVVSAHLWRCACKARRQESEQVTNMRFPVNFRNHMEPPLPKDYFGNATVPVLATTTSGELVSKPLAYASGKIRQAKEMVTNEYVKSYLAYLKNEPDLSRFRYFHVVGYSEGLFYGNPNIAITSWSTLSYGINFGWGKEIYFGPGTVAYDGKTFIIRNNNEDGSLVVAMRLQVAHMDTFKKFFYEDICYSKSKL